MWSVEDLQHWCADTLVESRVLEEVDSTSAWLKRHTPERPQLVVAWRQTAGYGQQGRSWCMRPGQDLVFSIWLPQQAQVAKQPALTPWLAYQLHRQLSPLAATPLYCKWPNDLYNAHGKVSGTLVEVYQNGLIIGTGINWLATETMPNALGADMKTIPGFLQAWSHFVLERVPRFTLTDWDTALAGWQDVDLFQPRQQVRLQDGCSAIYLGPDQRGNLQVSIGSSILHGQNLRLQPPEHYQKS